MSGSFLRIQIEFRQDLFPKLLFRLKAELKTKHLSKRSQVRSALSQDRSTALWPSGGAFWTFLPTADKNYSTFFFLI